MLVSFIKGRLFTKYLHSQLDSFLYVKIISIKLKNSCIIFRQIDNKSVLRNYRLSVSIENNLFVNQNLIIENI